MVIEPKEPMPGPSGLQKSSDRKETFELEEEMLQDEEETGELGVYKSTKKPTWQALLEADNFFLKEENIKLSNKLEALSVSFSFDHIKNNEHRIRVYTGLPTKEIFLNFFSLFENLQLQYIRGWQVVNMPKIDQLLLTLMKLKLNLLNDDLACRFNVSRETVSNIFKTWLFALHEILFVGLIGKCPSRNKNKTCMPSSFSTFTNCRMILDCTEMCTIHSKNMEKQRATYSSYKHHNTLKGLIGVAPNGVVIFASALYPGSISDKKITANCGVLKEFVAGDLIVADKGFLIAELLPPGVALNLPPFLYNSQFTEEEAVMTRTIARARIHVERAINRIKSHKILNMIPEHLIPHASVVFQVCAALTNLRFPLIKEVEGLYDY